jgi:D-alanine-D-alanine ligase
VSDKYYSSEDVLKKMEAQVRRFNRKLKNMKIAVLSGGPGEEASVSLESGKCVQNALKEDGLEAELVIVEKDIASILRKKWDRFDIVFNVMHGKYGEDGAVQGMFELMGKPVVGSKLLGSSVCFDKSFTKMMFALLAIPTPRWLYVPYLEGVRPEVVIESWTGPSVVKPLKSGSSVGIEFLPDPHTLLRELPGLVKKYRGVIVEEPVQGRELTAAVIDSFNPIALPVVEILPKKDTFFSYKSKYTKGETEYEAPARITGGQFEKIAEYSLRFFRAAKLSSYARFDLILDGDGKPRFLECNTLPGFTETSLVPMAASAFGLSYLDLLKFLILDTVKIANYV